MQIKSVFFFKTFTHSQVLQTCVASTVLLSGLHHCPPTENQSHHPLGLFHSRGTYHLHVMGLCLSVQIICECCVGHHCLLLFLLPRAPRTVPGIWSAPLQVSSMNKQFSNSSWLSTLPGHLSICSRMWSLRTFLLDLPQDT